jgi:hypothetical protein
MFCNKLGHRQIMYHYLVASKTFRLFIAIAAVHIPMPATSVTSRANTHCLLLGNN